MAKEFWDINDLSEFLGVKKSTLYGMVESGGVPHYKIGRLIRFKRDEMTMWMEGHRRGGVAPEGKAKEIIKGLKKPRMDMKKIVTKAVEEVKGSRYNLTHGKPDRIKGLRKEVSDGTL